MDAVQYFEILEDGVVESFEKSEVAEEERIFQQDNDPKHTSKRQQSGLKTIVFKILICLFGVSLFHHHHRLSWFLTDLSMFW